MNKGNKNSEIILFKKKPESEPISVFNLVTIDKCRVGQLFIFKMLKVFNLFLGILPRISFQYQNNFFFSDLLTVSHLNWKVSKVLIQTTLTFGQRIFQPQREVTLQNKILWNNSMNKIIYKMNRTEGVWSCASCPSTFFYLVSQYGTFGQPVIHQITSSIIILVQPVPFGIWRFLPFLKNSKLSKHFQGGT